jgi:hypothetical protein
MELSASWEAASRSDTKEFSNISWNPKARYRVYRSLSWARSSQSIPPHPISLRPCATFRKKWFVYIEEFLATRPTPKLEDYHLSAVRYCLFSIIAATLHIWRPSPPSSTWGRALPWWQGTHLTWIRKYYIGIIIIIIKVKLINWFQYLTTEKKPITSRQWKQNKA